MATESKAREISWRDFGYYAFPLVCVGIGQGWDTASMGGLLAMPQFLTYFDTPSAFRQGAIVAALIAGEFGGSLIIGLFLSDRLGRRHTIMLSALLFLVGQVLSTAAINQTMLIVGRVINGFGNAGLTQTTSMLIAEQVPARIRGQIGSNQNVGIALGLFVAYWVQYGTVNISGNAAWRVPFALQLLWPLPVLADVLFFRPESPRYLLLKGRRDEARLALLRLHRQDHGEGSSAEVERQLSEIADTVAFEKRTGGSSYTALLFGPQKRRTFLAYGAQFMQQVTGINIILYYAPKVFAQAGLSATKISLLANSISGAVILVATVAGMILSDPLGRRTCMTVGPLGQGLCLLIAGLLLHSYGVSQFDEVTQSVTLTFKNLGASYTAVAFMFLYLAFFGLFYASPAWIVPNEVLSSVDRAKGTAISTSANWLVNFWFGLYIPDALNKLQWKMYIIFAAINFACVIVTFVFQPETSRRTLEEIDLLFTLDRTPFVCLDKEARSRKAPLAGFGIIHATDHSASGKAEGNEKAEELAVL